jgi:hypothetical protein
LRVIEWWNATCWGGAEDDYNLVWTPAAENTLAFAEDGSSYAARLLTRPTFGCVMWEARDE